MQTIGTRWYLMSKFYIFNNELFYLANLVPLRVEVSESASA